MSPQESKKWKAQLEVFAESAAFWKDSIGAMQVAVYVMAGGGFLGRAAAEQPADFYIDSRVTRRPYPVADICRAVEVLATIAKANGLDPHNLPEMPRLHNLSVF